MEREHVNRRERLDLESDVNRGGPAVAGPF